MDPTKDPRRWSDPGSGATDELRRLLASGRPTRSMTAAEEARTAARVARLATSPPSGAPRAPRVGPKRWLGVAGAAGVVAAVWSASTWRAHHAAPAAVPVAAAPPAAGEPAPPQPDERDGTRPPLVQATAPRAAPGVARRAAARATSAGGGDDGNEAGDDPLAREQQMLERARSVVDRDPGAALAQLALYARRFPNGQLAAEKDLLRVTALERLGRHAEARAVGDALIARSPHSIYVERVRAILRERF
jgi:hypothetical protein